MISEKTQKDLNKIFSAGFVPGSTVSMDDIAQDCDVRLTLPVLPSESTVDIGFEVCGIIAPLFEELDADGAVPLAA
ncbi:MAG: hypothetical protein PHC70_02190 [Patescibacteria group bacterium]|jgi:hypothetical protein|nr:hypothetical protein [Patescibacteria group bacterium]